MSLFDLTGKVAVVTGGSRGIGRAICERMAEQGAKVVVSSRKIDACQEVVDAIKAKGGQAMAIACNIGRKNECQALIDQTIAAWGQVDIMVCNAAINPHFGPAVTMPDEIFDKIMAAMQPEFKDETPINPFDFWQGANFKLKAKNVAGYRNYDSSEFASQGALLDDDDAMEGIWKKQYSLAELVAADQFKSYDELKKRLDYVLGTKGARRQDPDEGEEEEYTRGPVKDLDEDLRTELNNLQPTRRAAAPVEDDDDDALSYFARLAED